MSHRLLARASDREHPLLLTLSQEATTMSNRSLLLSLAAALLASSFAGDGRGADPADPDQARLHAALLPTDNAGLVNFFQSAGARRTGAGHVGPTDRELWPRPHPMPGSKPVRTSSPSEHRPCPDCGPWCARAAGPRPWPGIA